jgi:hypothetical protein
MPLVQNEKTLFEGQVYLPAFLEDSCQWFLPALDFSTKKKVTKKGQHTSPCERSISGSFPPREKTFHAKNKHFLALEEEKTLRQWLREQANILKRGGNILQNILKILKK